MPATWTKLHIDWHFLHGLGLRWPSWVGAGKAELGTLIAVMLFASLCLGFAQVADEMIQGDTRSFDSAVILSMRDANDRADPVGPPWFEEAVRDVTSLGSTTILILISLGVVGYLGLSGAHGAALLVMGSVGGGMAVTQFLKVTFARARPDLVSHAAKVFSESFPSGHATMSAVTYLTLGALLARVQPNAILKTYILTVAVTLTLLVGVSRVYLGVHWPTDVLAGWCFGAAWAIACWLCAVWLQRRGQVEKRIHT
jgi:undecaprenyl-diphosphatase